MQQLKSSVFLEKEFKLLGGGELNWHFISIWFTVTTTTYTYIVFFLVMFSSK